MKVFYILTILIFFQGCSQNEKSEIVNLPITYVDGYGPFMPGWSPLSNQRNDDPEGNAWGKIYLPIKGIPKGWSQVKKEMIWMDSYQLVYQSYLAGRIKKERYKDLQDSWKWTPDSKKLSTKPIKCYVYVIWGVDRAGNWAAMVDTNNNLDFSDEVPLNPEVIDAKNFIDSRNYKESRIVTFEAFQKGRIVTIRIPIVIKQMGGEFVYNFPRHAITTLVKNGKKYPITIASGTLTRPSFEATSITGEVANNKILFIADLIKNGQNLELGSLLNRIKYKNLGVDWHDEVLRLEGIAPDKIEYILQTGYPLKTFEAKEFTSNKRIALKELNDKYVYLDFWGTWCKGCVADLPGLNKTYESLDKNKFEFVGIVADDSLRLKKGIKEFNIKWPQVLSSTNGNLIEMYNVNSFPTSVLLDKGGKIIAMNLRNEALVEKLRELSLK